MVMIVKRYLVKKGKLLLACYWLVSLFLLHSGNLAANSNSYQLDEISQLNQQQIKDKNWQQIVANPSNKEQFFIINGTGQLYLLEDTIAAKAILDLTSVRSVRSESTEQNDNAVIKLTAMALHPSFSLRDQAGYGTFYTAHLEPINKKSKTKRLQERSADLALEFDAVITEWQFNSVNHQHVDLSTKREVLRIAVPDESFTIAQLSFNPAVKSWNDNFGLLYISLSGDKKWQKPLYSGVILRINPTKFGLRSFTVPSDNPFLKDSQIKDAIYLLGGQGIQQFIWPDKHSEQILLVHQYNQQNLLSLTAGRDDWRIKVPKKILYQSDEVIDDLLMYRGRKLPYLRNKLLLLKHDDQNWSMESLVFKGSLSARNNEANTPQVEWQFTQQQLPANSQASFSVNLSAEILLLDNNENLLYHLSQNNLDLISDSEEQIPEEASSGNSFLAMFILAIIGGAFYYLVKRNKFSAKTLVRQQYAHLELSESKQQIGLYRRHKSSAEIIIDLADIVSSEVQLNESCINFINHDVGHGFSDDKEQDLRAIFTKEHVDKMIDGKIRQISVQLTDKQKHNYVVCLYMRKGSNRITKKSYAKVIDELIDWCWLIGKQINAGQTSERKVKAVAESAESAAQMAAQQKKAAPLHNQAAAIRPATHKTLVEPAEQSKTQAKPTFNPNPKAKVIVANATEQVANKVVAKPKAPQTSAAIVAKHTNSTIDTELVNALEKLVALKQQGFLTTDEFAQAKAKLLKNLFDKS